MYPPFPLQVDALTTLPGLLTTLLVVALVIFVARIVLKWAWRIVLAAVVVAALLWVLGLLGPLSGLLGV